MKYFSNETLNFFFRKFWACYILYLAKVVRVCKNLTVRVHLLESAKDGSLKRASK